MCFNKEPPKIVLVKLLRPTIYSNCLSDPGQLQLRKGALRSAQAVGLGSAARNSEGTHLEKQGVLP